MKVYTSIEYPSKDHIVVVIHDNGRPEPMLRDDAIKLSFHTWNWVCDPERHENLLHELGF